MYIYRLSLFYQYGGENMDREELIEKLKELAKELKPSLVRRKEQIKGIIWILENTIPSNIRYEYEGMFSQIKKHYK